MFKSSLKETIIIFGVVIVVIVLCAIAVSAISLGLTVQN